MKLVHSCHFFKVYLNDDDDDDDYDNNNITGACHTLSQGDYTHRQTQVAKSVHQDSAIKCGRSKGPPMPY